MCMNCGCGEIDARHGNEANIVADDVRRAASVNKQDLNETIRNLEASLRRVGSGGMAAAGAGGGSRTGTSSTGSGRTNQATPRR